MNSDCAFYIGTTHEVCQDYALSNNGNIVVSDGCSGSENTDIGSRVLAITAMNKMKEIKTLRDFNHHECILLARPSVKMLDIPNDCLDATLLLGTSNGRETQAMVYGDGVVAVKEKTGNTYIINCSYTDNYPFYINYAYDKRGRYEGWITNHNKKNNSILVMKANGNVKVIQENFEKEVRLSDFGIVYGGSHNVLVDVVDTGNIEHISIMSDGVGSFYETIVTETSKYNKSISYLEILKDLLAFKNYNKAFVQRRVKKFKKDCIKKNWGNADDVSLATIYTGE